MLEIAPTPSLEMGQLEPVASLVEVFSAIQGEGLNVGTRQIFIRFGGCDLRCSFCDSAHTWHPQSTCQIERSPGLRDWFTAPNPVSLDQLLAWVTEQDQPRLHDSISLTGGEPLLQVDFLAAFLPRLRDRSSLALYLETGGHLPQALERILPHLDLVGMDIKLPSVSGESHWAAHGQFLHLCQQAGVAVFCKLILSQQTETADLLQARHLIAALNPEIPIFLQPVTPLSSAAAITAPTPDQVLAWQALFKHQIRSVRVIPQTHKAIGQR